MSGWIETVAAVGMLPRLAKVDERRDVLFLKLVNDVVLVNDPVARSVDCNEIVGNVRRVQSTNGRMFASCLGVQVGSLGAL